MAKKQTWKVKIFTWLSSLLDKENPVRYYKPAMITPAVIVAEKFLQNVASETGLSTYQARAVLSSIVRTAGDYMEAGNAVQLDEDFGTLKPFIKVKGTNSKDDCSAKSIVGVGIKFIPTGKMKNLLSDVQFTFVGTTDDQTGIDDSEVVNPNDQPEGDNNQPAVRYTLTLKRANNTVISTTELEAGAAITYPTATSGYMWPADAPTVMPAEATTVTEVVDDDPNVL